MSLWKKPTTIVGNHGLISKSPANGADSNREFLLFQWADEIYLGLYDNNGSNRIAIYSASNVFAADTWAHVIATYDGSGVVGGLKLYVDNVDVSDTDGSAGTYVAMHSTSSPIEIGRENVGVDIYFGGLMDEILVWNRVITPGERAFLYRAGSGRVIK
jgi:hypothetical protein